MCLRACPLASLLLHNKVRAALLVRTCGEGVQGRSATSSRGQSVAGGSPLFNVRHGSEAELPADRRLWKSQKSCEEEGNPQLYEISNA